MERTLRTAKGKTVTTPYTDGETLIRLQKVPGTFAADLRKKLPLSHDQMVWAHVLVLEFEQPNKQRETVEIGNLAAVIAMFNAAKAHLKHPKIRLSFGNGIPVCLSVAGPKASKPGSINVTDGGKYGQSRFYGRIYQDGNFEIARAGAPSGLPEFLTSFAQDPIKVASEYGHMTGNCCFCNRTLTDERSTTVGYGPVCADHFGLSWGSKVGSKVRPEETTAVSSEAARGHVTDLLHNFRDHGTIHPEAASTIPTEDDYNEAMWRKAPGGAEWDCQPDITDQIERDRLREAQDDVDAFEYSEAMAGRL